MRKSNWIIVAILVIASVIFLALWYALGFNLIDDPLDLVVTIVWWIIIVGVCVAIKLAEDKRRKAIRTSFIAPGLIYNPEAGIVKVEEPRSYTSTLQGILDDLNYGFEKKGGSNDKRIRFTYIVRTDRFERNGAQWDGEVVRASNPDDVKPFRSMQELVQLIDAG